MVGQIAKQLRCRVVGIAGGAGKVQHLLETFGFDAGVDYRDAHFAERLQQACPGGIDIYFDNVGGSVRDAAWPHMNLGGRVVVCGQIAEYNASHLPGPGWMPVRRHHAFQAVAHVLEHTHGAAAIPVVHVALERVAAVQVVAHAESANRQPLAEFTLGPGSQPW